MTGRTVTKAAVGMASRRLHSRCTVPYGRYLVGRRTVCRVAGGVFFGVLSAERIHQVWRAEHMF